MRLHPDTTDIFFDLDHTLWDFEKNSALTFEKAFSFHLPNIDTPQFLKHYNPINQYYWKLYRENKISQEELRYARLEKTFLKIEAPQDPALIKVISEIYIENLSTFTHLFEHTHELLRDLKTKYRLHIITNGFESVQHRKISNSGLKVYFDQVFTAEKIGQKKPHPLIFETALEQTQTQARKAVMIGDNVEADIQGALALGMQAIHFNSHNEPEHELCPIVYSLAEIKKMF